MSAVRTRRWWSGARKIPDRLGAALLVAVAGVVFGLQYVAPNKRVLAVLAAVAMFGITWRLEMVSGLGLLVLALPFPRATVFGSTTLAFTLLLLIIWLLRASLGQSPPPRRSPLDMPLIALFICYVLSFYNIDSADMLQKNLVSLEMMVVAWVVFYLVSSNIRTRADLLRLLNFQAVSILLICLVGVFEVSHPGVPLIPGWIEFPHPGGTLLAFRAGSIFYDYELLCEFCALSALLLTFLLLRSRSLLLRTAYVALLMLDLFTMFTTVTRGGMISLGVGLLYLLWTIRRRLNMVTTTILAGAAAACILAINWFVATYTRTGDLFQRIAATTVVKYMPENRVLVWTEAWNRIFEHPLIGHGPYYSGTSGARIYYWPHCLYLYVANNVGFIGLAVFLWVLWTLFRISRPRTDDLRHPDPAEAYMIIARTQLIVFLVDQIKIEYLRYDIYEFQVWLMFALMAATSTMLRASEAQPARAAIRWRAPAPQPAPRPGVSA